MGGSIATLAQSHTKQATEPSGSPEAGRQSQPYKFSAALTAGLFLLAFTPRVQNVDARLFGDRCRAGTGRLADFPDSDSASTGQTFGFKVVLRQHYIGMMVQFSVYLYWGYYWRPVYEHLWLLAARVLFAFSFDMLLSWSANAITPSVLARFRSSSAPICSCGSGMTGSIFNF